MVDDFEKKVSLLWKTLVEQMVRFLLLNLSFHSVCSIWLTLFLPLFFPLLQFSALTIPEAADTVTAKIDAQEQESVSIALANGSIHVQHNVPFVYGD